MRKSFADTVLTKSIIAQKPGEYRCAGAHSTKKCVAGVDKAIGVSNIINYIEINLKSLK